MRRADLRLVGVGAAHILLGRDSAALKHASVWAPVRLSSDWAVRKEDGVIRSVLSKRSILSVLGISMITLASVGPGTAQESAIGYPRFFDPRQRCHDAPHAADSNSAFPARISVLPGGICVVRQATGRNSAYQLVGYEVIELPGAGRLVRQSASTYAYRAPAGGSGFDSFTVRLIYEDPTGRLAGPELRYEVRIGR